jgi:hypothetical protein
MALLLPVPKFHADSANGTPLSGGKLYTYEAGTTTPQATYTDQGGGTTNANPVVLNSRGEADVWLDPALTYKMVLKDSSDVTIWTVDQISESRSSADWTFLPSGAGAVTRTVQAKLRDYTTVKDFGAVGDGVADDTLAIQAAIDSFPAGKGTVYFPTGIYRITSTLSVTQDRIHLRGAGRWSATIAFEPTANDTALVFTKGALVLYQCSITDINFTSGDSTYEKIAIDLVDVSAFTMRDITVGPLWNGGAGGSIGLRVRGRDTSVCDAIELYCDRPLVISDNPNASIDIDHFRFTNVYMLGVAAHPLVKIDTGVNVTQLIFDGFQAWVGGEGGLYWVDTTTVGVSQGLLLANVRYENSRDTTKYFVRIEHNSGLQGLIVQGGQTGLSRGFYLRNARNVTFDTFYYTDSSREALNANSTNYPIDIRNCFWQAGSTATLDGMTVYHKAATLTSMPLPEIGLILPTNANNANYDEQINTTISGPSASVAHDSKLLIGGANQAGFVFISTSDDVSAIYELRGATAAVAEVADVAGWFTPAGGGGNYEVGWDGTNYYVQNKTGLTKNVRVMRIGRSQ